MARHMMESLSTEPSLGWITTHGGSGGRTKCQTKCDDDGQILILMILTQITDPQGLSCSRFFWVVGYLLVYSSHPTMLVVGPLSCPGIFSWMDRIFFTKVSSESEVEEMTAVARY